MRQTEVEDVRKYIHASYMALLEIKEFFYNFVAQILFFPVKFIILFFVWKCIYGYLTVDLAYSMEELLGYYFILAIMETVMIPSCTVTYEEWDDISRGKISLELTKPISYVARVYMRKLGEFIIQLLIGLFFVGLMVVILNLFFGIHIPIKNGGWFLITVFMGFTIMVCLFQIVGHVTFWLENVLSLRDNLWNVIRILSGELFPIAMYPLVLRRICVALPFRYIYDLPISVLLGKTESRELIAAVMIEIIWCVILIPVNAMIWRKGLKKYSAQGG